MDPSDAIFQTLTKKGWNFKDPEEIKTLIRSNNSQEMVELELLNMDLRSIGVKSLPDSTSLKKSSYVSGPKVLQLVSVRDIYLSSIDALSKTSQRHRRLLRFVLTDGQSEVTAIEYVPIPSITEEIIPGTKIRLENKIVVRNGILCLNPNAVAILGGIVPSLYEEWQMSQKYSGFSRSSMRLPQNENGVGPPPFEKLQIEPLPYQAAQRPGSHAGTMESISRYSSHQKASKPTGINQANQVENKGWASNDPKSEKPSDAVASSTKESEDKPSTSDGRPKEVSEAVPVQNQAAAQKLLEKMVQPLQGEKNFRGGHKHRFKGKQEESQVFTLEEWERRKASSLKPSTATHVEDVFRDEELARQLQNQFDFEDFSCSQETPKLTEAERIRMSMFSFGGPEESGYDGRPESRGRGRGRGRGEHFEEDLESIDP